MDKWVQITSEVKEVQRSKRFRGRRGSRSKRFQEVPKVEEEVQDVAAGVARLDAPGIVQIAYEADNVFNPSDIELMNLTKLSDVCDYFLILSATNSRQADALIDEIEEKVAKNCGVKPISIEGRANLSWVLMDYGSVVIHVFLPETRDFYRLERLWGEAPRVELDLQ